MAFNILLAIIAALISVVGQTLLKAVMTNVGAIDSFAIADLFAIVLTMLKQPLFYVAGIVYVMGFGAWLVVLSRVELNVAYPVLALSYVFIPIAGMLFFGETVTPLRWLGIAIILAGVVVVGLSYGK
ncbi:MAG: EamA family transporter [Anaerolineae bacterium]|nr:EamA family transporter [Anaerolineae bacterium]